MTNHITRRDLLAQSAAAVCLGATALGTQRRAHAFRADFAGKFAICNETFGQWPLDRALALAAECGYQGLEIAPFTVSPLVTDVSAQVRQQMRRQVEAAGLTVVGLHWLLARTTGLHLTSPDADVRRRTADYLGALAEFCADLGGDLLVFGSPQQRNLQDGVTWQQGLQYAAEVIRQAMRVLGRNGVRLAIEPLSPKTTNFLRTAAEAWELIRLVDSPRCQLILDCNAMATEPTAPADLIRRLGSQLLHFHANDPNSQGPGFGNLDFVPIFQALRDVEYSGWVSVEVFDYDPGPERLARESIVYMKKCLEATH